MGSRLNSSAAANSKRKIRRPLLDPEGRRLDCRGHPTAAKAFAFSKSLPQAKGMVQPLALVLYEKLLPGSQLVNRLQDLHYRVQTITDASLLVSCAEQTKPMLVLADLQSTRDNVRPAIASLRQSTATAHIPVIAFAADEAVTALGASAPAGVTLLVTETALLSHLPHFLEQALQVE
jgi:CheY-like chemotaxis protein